MNEKSPTLPPEYSYRRFPTREIRIGNLLLGGNQPVRIQSMVNTAPGDLNGTVEQIRRLADAGSELVRLTVPTLRDAHNLEKLMSRLKAAGIAIPIVADVHFNAQIASVCAGIVEKVRINPGNYRKPGGIVRKQWSDTDYLAELAEVEELLTGFIEICRKHQTAVRIGSNHGSLSPRITDRYGDTPLGMVEAAMEFVRIFHRHGFHELVLSMKSSNVRVMVQAYRLLVTKMIEEGFDYPVHLGVTEAGSGTEGRVKSAAGIGLLLDEGIGDTIRISLTEDPVEEIPAARKLLERYRSFTLSGLPFSGVLAADGKTGFRRRETLSVAGIGAGSPPVVIGQTGGDPGFEPDLVVQDHENPVSPSSLLWGTRWIPVVGPESAEKLLQDDDRPFLQVLPETPDVTIAKQLANLRNAILVLQAGLSEHTENLRQWMSILKQQCVVAPVILKIDCGMADRESIILNTSVTASCLLTDGLTDGLWITAGQEAGWLNKLSFQILQATRARISAPEYISCPSCGRTRFNIQEVAERIKERTSHLVGLRIGIMGCIVNGPGEMADADYGYVGAGNNTVTLYKGKEVVRRGVREEEAIDALIALIKEGGDWKEP